ncbi:TetR/AcrR family transcriptional regulator C-terminal domain-containing protein [Dactylosporangium sp. NPDC005572]|uniref:TetR/AcrR family transcriptional regulator C-terminal domain-containing protein n=1 Tax=Dactylosporangium sp. NPDC005572 TaxID=3156889 RepID=UPI0033B24B96
MSAHGRLSQEILAQTALALADDEGVESVTVRRLAQRHSVTPMALYRHFKDKDEIFDSLAERLLASVAIPAPDRRPWHEQTHDLLTAFVAALRPHPNAAGLILGRILDSNPGLVVAERMLVLLTEAGFGVEAAAETASQALCSVVTLVVTEPGRRRGADAEARDDAIRAKKATLTALSPRHYPHVVAAANALASCSSEEQYYARGIRMIVAGIRGIQAALETAVA